MMGFLFILIGFFGLLLSAGSLFAVSENWLTKTVGLSVTAFFFLMTIACWAAAAQISECFGETGNRALCFMFEESDQ